MSSAYASTRRSSNGAAFFKILCCWDDPKELQICQRQYCPYQHSSDIAKQQPNAPQQDFFGFMPCNFQGMTGRIDGCTRHRLRFMSPMTWHVPRCELSEGGEAPRTHSPPEGAELVPMYVGQTWVLQEDIASYDRRMHKAVRRFLEGLESECEDESSDEKRPGDADEL